MEKSNSEGSNCDAHLAAELQMNSETLIAHLKEEKFDEASVLIKKLMPSMDQKIYNSVGTLTRALHDAIVNFNVDVQPDVQGGRPPSEISDASDRLQYVISMTQEAADKTMDRVELAAPIALNLGQEAAQLKAEWDRLKRREMSKTEFVSLYDRMNEFFLQMVDGTEQLNANLQAIILEQGYQDLTGQVLKKVIGLVTDVEVELVNLVKIASQIEDVAGIEKLGSKDSVLGDSRSIHAEGPQINKEERADVVSGQDDVDDLLSSLGF